MSIEIRALNAQYEGSLIEIERDGAPPVTVVASPRLEVLQILRVSDRQALVLLRAFGGTAGEVAMLDIDDARIVRRTSLTKGSARRLLRSPDGRRIAILGESAIAVLDGETLGLLHLWSSARHVQADSWRLEEAGGLSRDKTGAMAAKPQGAEHFILRPVPHAAAFRADGTIRTLFVSSERIEHGEGYFHTFRASLEVVDVDVEAGTLRRRTLWSGETPLHNVKGSEILAMDPGGRFALVRHSRLVATPEETGRGIARLWKRVAGDVDPSAPPPGMIASRAEVWDLDTLRQVAPFDVGHFQRGALLGAFKPNHRPACMLRSDTPLAPRPMSGRGAEAENPDAVIASVAAGLPVDVAWMPDGTMVVLLHQGLLRQIRPDGTAGPLLRPEGLPYFGLNQTATRLPLELVRLRPEGPDRIVLQSGFAEAEVVLPPFAKAALSDTREQSVPVRVIRDRASWDQAFGKVRRGMLRLRPGNVTIPDRSPRSIVPGLHQMAEILRSRYGEVIMGRSWSPTFLVKDKAFPEEAFCAALLDAPIPGAAEALDALVRAFMRHQRAEVDVTAAEDPKARDAPIVMCLTETVLTAIRLSDRIPAGCWRWIVWRDGLHDTYTSEVLGPRVIEPLGLQGRDDLLTLAVRVGLQDFVSQSWECSILRIGAMQSVAADLHDGRLAPERLARLLRRQLRAQARTGGLSWSTKAGEQAIVEEIARRLDATEPTERALAGSLAS
jgi:hypothetical protein